ELPTPQPRGLGRRWRAIRGSDRTGPRAERCRRGSRATSAELAQDCRAGSLPITQVERASRGSPRIGGRGINLREDLLRSALSATLPYASVMLGPNGVADDARDLHTGLAKLGDASGVFGVEADVQEPHDLTVKTHRLYGDLLSESRRGRAR